MDFLASINVEDLPEQQTRIHTLVGDCGDDEPDLHDGRLGFDLCCSCGKKTTTKNVVGCQSCRRINYCSKECRYEDANCSNASFNPCDGSDNAILAETDHQSQGHSPVVCALLGLCNDDDLVESGVLASKNSKHSNGLTTERRNAAFDRVVSEYESYPATLANVIMDGPCYQNALQKALKSTLTIHVIGASDESELHTHPDKEQERTVFDCYADAMAEIAETYKLKRIVLHFIGPECRKNIDTGDLDIPKPIIQHDTHGNKKHLTTKLRIMTSNTDYDGSGKNNAQNHQSAPDILVFFNPGFTCPDYYWKDTLLSCMKNTQLPFLVTTNTEMEALMDMQYLFDNNFFQNISPELQSILQNDEDDDTNNNSNSNNYHDDKETFVDDNNDDDNNKVNDPCSFFSLNPYCGLRVRQSGTLANDLYVKSRWIFGGCSGPLMNTKTATLSSKDHRATELSQLPSPAKKRKWIEGENANKKKTNPALV